MHALLCVLLYRDVGVDYPCVFFSGHWWLIAGQVKVVRDQVTGELLRQSIVPYHMDSLVKGSQRRHKAAMQRLEYVYFYFFSLEGLKNQEPGMAISIIRYRFEFPDDNWLCHFLKYGIRKLHQN